MRFRRRQPVTDVRPRHSPTSVKDMAHGVVEDLRAIDADNIAWRVAVLQAALAIEEHAFKVHQVRTGQVEGHNDD